MEDTETQIVVAAVATVPLRRHPKDASEMVSQLLLGESARPLDTEQNGRWIKIKLLHDGYEGWCNANETVTLPKTTVEAWKYHHEPGRSTYHHFQAIDGAQDAVTVPPGAMVAINHDNGTLTLPFGTFDITDELHPLKEPSLLDTALNFLGIPYLWGGRTTLGIDCSGFVQTVLALHGLSFPRDSSVQAGALQRESGPLSEAEPGDIVYFTPTSDRITHVGFYLGEGLLLHASGKVRIHCIEEQSRYAKRYEYHRTLAESIAGFQRIRTIRALKPPSNAMQQTRHTH